MKILSEPAKIVRARVEHFGIPTAGWHAICVAARVKSEKQRGENQTDDEDLILDLDGQKFPMLGSGRFIDSPAAFSGGQQKNILKTVYLIVYLNSGKHSLSLIPDWGAFLENVEVNPLDDFPYCDFSLNLQAENCDCQPVVTFALVNTALKSFTVKASLKWHVWDGDDLKIIVDGKIKQNNFSVFHRDWIFASSVWRKLSGKETQEKTFLESLPVQDLHYIEFWADRTPTINNINFKLSSEGNTQGEGQKVLKIYNPGPKAENYNRLDQDIINAVKKWNNTFASQKFPVPVLLDPNLVKAMVYTESYMGYGAPNGDYPSYPDVMQVADGRNPAIHTLNNDGWVDPNTNKIAREYEWDNNKTILLDCAGKANGNTSAESIYWGTRWLYHKAQGILGNGDRYWKSWEDAVRDYNKNNDTAYQKKVYKVYDTGTDTHGYKLWPILVFLFVVASVFTGFLSFQGKFYAYREDINNNGDWGFYLQTLDGFKQKKFLVDVLYHNGANLNTFYYKNVSVTQLEPLKKGTRLLEIRGQDISHDQTVSIVSYVDGNFHLMPKLGEYGGLENTFNADSVSIISNPAGVGNEVVEYHLVPYSNTANQIWKSYYVFDEKQGAYRFRSKIKENAVTGEKIEEETLF